MSAKEMRKKGLTGGEVTRETHGLEHFQRVGKLGGEATRERGKEYFQEIGRAGGTKTAQLGAEHYAAIGKAGAKRREANMWNRALEAALEALATSGTLLEADERLRGLKRTT